MDKLVGIGTFVNVAHPIAITNMYASHVTAATRCLIALQQTMDSHSFFVLDPIGVRLLLFVFSITSHLTPFYPYPQYLGHTKPCSSILLHSL